MCVRDNNILPAACCRLDSKQQAVEILVQTNTDRRTQISTHRTLQQNTKNVRSTQGLSLHACLHVVFFVPREKLSFQKRAFYGG